MAVEETQKPATQEPRPMPPPQMGGAGDDGQAGPGRGGRGRLFRIVLVLLVVCGILLVVGLLPRLHRRPELNAAAQQQKDVTPTVNTVPVQAPPSAAVLTLPGNIQAVQQTAITARASGYIQKYLVDIGDRVRAGQTLAIIETPDVTQQVVQARAQVGGSRAALAQSVANLSNQRAGLAQAGANLSRAVATLEQARTQLAQSQAAVAQAQQNSAQQGAQLVQAQSNLDLARVTAQRYQNLLAQGAIDQQTTDQAVASYRSNYANVQALAAAVRSGQANVTALRDAVLSSRANVAAYRDAVASSRAQVTAAAAQVTSAQAGIASAQDNVRASQANQARLVVLQGFNKVTAPFPGVITSRNVDNGALISAAGGVSGSGADSSAGGSATGSGSSPGATSSASGGGTATSLFSLAQTDRLRIYLNVPQSYAGAVRVGQSAQVLVRDQPQKSFLGKVARTSVALDATTRTLVTEVQVANPRGLLQPGDFAQVRLRVTHAPGALLVPDSALITNAGGTQVLIVTKKGTLHFQPITVGRDFGQTIEVPDGVQVGQQVVATPNDNLREGQQVHAQPAPPPAQGG